MNKDLISIIVPTYNREKTIKGSIESLIKQTYDNIEIIIVDDGSTDNTEKAVAKLKDSRVRYIKLPENKGACYARNVGIRESRGKYIMFNDSDDTFADNKVEEQYRNIIVNKSDMDFCKLKIHSDERIIEVPSQEQLLDIEKHGILSALCKANFISTQSFLVKKSVIEKYLFDESLPRLQDYDLMLRMIPHIKVSFSDMFLADLYRQSDSISRSNVKLSKAIATMYVKNYDLSKKNSEMLKQQFFRISEDLSGYIAFLEENINNSDIELEKLKYELKTITKNLEKVQNEKEEIELKYNRVVNSKGWKLLECARRVKKRILGK